MIRGIDTFRAHFAGHEDSYAVIGGAACDLLFEDAGLPFRATKDIDLVLCVEVVSADFGRLFAAFLKAGGYEARQRSSGRREFYRFHRPADETFPHMIELFARKPDALSLPDNVGLAQIPVEEDVISLSAILLNDDYYAALIAGRRVIGGVPVLDETLLIPFKARAYLDLAARTANGDSVNQRDVKKHRADVFRLAQLLPANARIDVAETIRADVEAFLAAVSDDETFDYDALKLALPLDEAVALLRSAYLFADSEA